jgi:hypothetical protein
LGANGVTIREANTDNPVAGHKGVGNYDAVISYQSSEDTGDLTDRSVTEPWNLPPFNISVGTRDVVVPQYRAYDDTDAQFNPSIPVIHPATKESLVVDTIEKHGIISFSYNLKQFDYDWKRKLENTVNKEAETILGYRFPAKNLLLRKIGARKKSFTNSSNTEVDFWQVDIEVEDFNKEITKEIALMGFLFLYDRGGANERIEKIQLNEGVYGWFNDPSKEVSSPVWVSQAGDPIQEGETVYGKFYQEFPDKFQAAWNSLSLPSSEE